MKEQNVKDGTGKKKKHFFFLLPLVFCILNLVTGCVQYDVGVNFDSQTHGAMVQHIKLGERLTSFSSETVGDWLKSVEKRARLLDGKTKRLSEREVIVTIPFNNGAELEDKFNQFYNPIAQTAKSRVASPLETDLPKFESHLSVKQNNLLLVLRNRLSLELDLRSLALVSSNGSPLLNPGGLLELDFSLNTPWGAENISTTVAGALVPQSYQQGKQLVWKLKPGEVNYLEATFWIPSPVGIGALIIALFVAAGIAVKYQILPALLIGKKQQNIGQA
ncbi:MAG: DUF3153 domain-containing protein [Microcoleus sp. PH2017_01_SCD_O_A]|uniref:DUF3153 domain-containing protein n=1 Tax=unclassified Microcoleus TaxID=2642155 RepID=UPI001E02358F|nr:MULTISPECIES: DUF3153 domain-containing protein [unclassified Microcoleus]MCC3509971.1 DUF3153 domain-containing protein [Microcoleus sp. PH2017_17_BER_D_A]TAF89404.1 MAG: DUF3153 domain-containing protein [Oscillatoriales cyanobacterium]MCC3426521.1 DUF3153 domain-containing protein [Microcoleus sp. PH2017_01_SCD_O_A]MCC3449220.1 DUF3153 domain-containing protein [Microcoleus sp. PH2017_09_SFU_O_A]MCC3630205.1 DUF3153 domain-containing protein [Microcoleus sp. PH2017_39_LGB_O_B]